MSLGVLNNLSAVYAENYLNNTNSSLNTVLQQLSSGSKINSGADDAAGLSLVNGLEANQQALNQSKTNAQEGSGLLQVADGALSQVTSLLNRAVTLATEAANGTLNSTQETAANQEYQSILSEVNNIGSTTTYNDQAVFNSSTNIYTGDASTAGSAIDDLNIRSLSSSNLGDTSGNMSYTTAAAGNNVFIDLTANGTAGTVASVNDYLHGGAGGTTTLDITTLSSTGSSVTNPVTVGGNSGYANSAAGMISAINAGGYGVTASFTTGAIAGDATAGADTGIMISGSVGAGTSPSSASFSGTISGETANTDIISGSLTMQVGNNSSTTVTAAQVAAADGIATGAVSMTDFGNYITANAGLGVTAQVSGGGVLSLSSSATGDPQLKVTSNLVDNSLTAGAAALSYTATSAYSAGVSSPTYASNGIVDSDVNSGGALTVTGSGTVGNATTGAAGTVTEANLSNTLFGAVKISTDAGAADWVTATAGQKLVAGLWNAGGNDFNLGVAGYTDTLAHLASTLNTAFGDGVAGAANLSAAVNGSGALVITEATGGTVNVAVTAPGAGAGSLVAQSATTADAIAAGGTSNGGGVATIGYTDKAGQSLSGTDLSGQADAESALTDLNTAIGDVAAQDGYVGAMINTLDAVSSVLSTQSENVQAAQNAVQSTDYAQATSNMSKYEILSQTGIAALAQANSQQQEVLKLLQ
jgi:flagellin